MEEFRKQLSIPQPPKIITLQDAILITSTSPSQEVTSPSDLPAQMLNKIMMLDCSSRELPESMLADRETQTRSISDFLELDSQDSSESPVNSMDVFLFLFIQSHPIFRQTLLTQVSKCQLSLPLVVSYPSPQEPTFYLFALKTLHKDYIRSDNSSASFSVTEEKLPIISFIKVGDFGKSQKSEILNRIIGIPNYFSNRNQLGNTKKRIFLDGTVEIAWLFPKIEPNIEGQSRNTEPCVILNLRGDAFSYPKVCQFLANISSFVYVFVPINHCDQSMSDKLTVMVKAISSRTKFLLYKEDFPINQHDIRYPKFINNESSLLLEKKNLGEDCNLISSSICSLLQNAPVFLKKSINGCISIARKLTFKVDLDEFNIVQCESFVESIVHRMLIPLNQVQSKPLAIVKKVMLPLQGETWSNWSSAKRELHNLELNGFPNMESAHELRTSEMTESRQKQVEMLKHPSPFLTDIFSHCKNYGRSTGDFYLFWKLLQNDFNSLSRLYLPPLYDEYGKLHQLKCSFKSVSNSDEKLADLQISLKEAARSITESSLGIEHVFRELGQVFEAYHSSSRKQKQLLERTLDFRIRNLDDIAAGLLVEGYAFEILDGDVSHVPVEWVTNVLKSLAFNIGNEKRIFVLSILGIQSTGKSTLLNTMFGANFPVSSGRCTRGIFMQLIQIAENLRSQLGYDFLVLLDTEGLRAPEHINLSYKRDNELATFAVGLGDATVINMYGEGHSDIQDILQIIVFAFIRMKETYSKPRCMFVHQNVPDTHAHTNLLTARSNLMKTLDRMTECAAQQENQLTFYKRFCDVIEFHPEEEVFYFPGLFEGEPPLNRISPAYAKNAAKLRECILNCFSKDKKKTFQTIEEWSNKLTTLWKAVLQENFVFSYRNALEVTARFELDHELSCWHSKYMQAMNEWKSESINLLFNADLETVEETWDNLISELNKERMNPTFETESQKRLVKIFFFDHENVEIMTQWKENIRLHIEKKRELQINEMEREYTMIHRVQQTKKEMDQKFTRCRKDIISKVNSLFIEMKDQGRTLKDQTLVESNFQNIWNEWKSQIEIGEIRKRNISTDLQRTFSDSPIIKSMNVLPHKSNLLIDTSKFRDIGNNNFEYLAKLEPSKEPGYFVWNDLVEKTTLTVLFSAIFKRRTRHDAGTNRFKNELQIIETECARKLNEYMAPLIKKLCPYDPNYFLIIIEKIHKILNQHNSAVKNINSQQSMEFTTEFIFDYIFFQCCKAIQTLAKIQDNFISRTSLDFKFNHLERQLRETFIRLCEGIQNEHSCALELANITFEGMKDYLSDSVSDIFLSVFQNDPKHSVTYHGRASLILSILKDLAHERKFHNYISYITDPFNYMIVYTQNQLKNHFKKRTVQKAILNLVIDRVTSLVEFYHNESSNSSFNLKELSNLSNWKSFKTKFHSAIKHKVRNLSYSDFDVLDIHKIENYEQFCNLYSQEMKKKISETDWNSWIEKILEEETSLYKNLTDHLMECKALCPFCKEPCQLSIGNHEHYCGTFHRPVGVNGWRYVDSREISLNNCTTSIKYKRKFVHLGLTYEYVNYKTVNDHFRSWKILGDDAMDSKYWQWVLYTFEKEFVEHYGVLKNAGISYWKYLTEEEVVKDLEMHYKIYIFKKK